MAENLFDDIVNDAYETALKETMKELNDSKESSRAVSAS
jgi:hypothetical protein